MDKTPPIAMATRQTIIHQPKPLSPFFMTCPLILRCSPEKKRAIAHSSNAKARRKNTATRNCKGEARRDLISSLNSVHCRRLQTTLRRFVRSHRYFKVLARASSDDRSGCFAVAPSNQHGQSPTSMRPEFHRVETQQSIIAPHNLHSYESSRRIRMTK